MAYFDVNVAQLSQYPAVLREISENLQSLNRRLLASMQALSDNFSEMPQIQQQMEETIGYLHGTTKRVELLGDNLEVICGRYAYYEEQAAVAGHYIESASADENGAAVSKNAVSDGFSMASKIIKVLNFNAENKQASAAASLLGMVGSGAALGDNSDSSKWFASMAGFTGSVVGFGSKLGKSADELIAKYGTVAAKMWQEKNEKILSKEMKELGSIGASINLASKALKTFQDSDSVSAVMKNTGELALPVKDLVKSVEGFGKEVDRGIAIPVAALAGMTGYMAGEIIDLSNDGHPVTVDEVADLSLKTALTGVKVGVSGITGGVVNIDVERSADIFHKNIDRAFDVIYSTDSILGQVSYAVAATPVVAAVSLTETFVDLGWQIGEKINSMFTNGDLSGNAITTHGGGGGMGGR